jgi:tetratricopeptide (TPR) repeat protein
MTLVRLGRVDEAISAYDKALRLTPPRPPRLYGLAKCKKGGLTGADADLTAARTISSRVAGDYASYQGATLRTE